MAQNTLYFGDNLKILRDNIRDETIGVAILCCGEIKNKSGETGARLIKNLP